MTISELIELLSLARGCMKYYATIGDCTRFDQARNVVDKLLKLAEEMI